ncbi:MAG: class I SAM-dependent methyltransferase [Desulfonatronovibrionaceae bacterium]
MNHLDQFYSEERLELTVSHSRWIMSKAGDLEEFWAKMTGENPAEEDHIPYWTEIWPAAVALGEYLYQKAREIKGRVCLDLGCGLGLTTLVAAECGARAVGADFQRPALDFARQNAFLNNTRPLGLVQMDWNSPCFAPGTLDFIWGADILYETRFFFPLAGFFKEHLQAGTRIWLADPVRNISPGIWERFANKGFAAVIKSEAEINAPGQKATVRLMEIRLQ